MSLDDPVRRLAAGIEAAVQGSARGSGDLARLLHVSERTLRRYRRGERIPTRSWLLDLERRCAVEPGSLVALLDMVPRGAPRAHAPEPTKESGEPSEPVEPGRRLTRRHRLAVTAGAAAVTVMAIVVAVTLAASSGHASRSRMVRAWSEYADNHLGSPVFANPMGAHIDGVPARIPYGTKVLIICEVANDNRRLSSVTAFYLVAAGRWKHDYVVSDTMSNGGPLGNTDTPNVDSRVPACSNGLAGRHR